MTVVYVLSIEVRDECMYTTTEFVKGVYTTRELAEEAVSDTIAEFKRTYSDFGDSYDFAECITECPLVGGFTG